MGFGAFGSRALLQRLQIAKTAPERARMASAIALTSNFRLSFARLGGSDALRSDLGAFRARSGVVSERQNSIFEAITAVFSMVLRTRTQA